MAAREVKRRLTHYRELETVMTKPKIEIKALLDDAEYRYEVWAPNGFNFGGEHSILATTKKVALEIARDNEASLEPCPQDCDCRDSL